MIKLGTQNISALRLGGQEIKKAYLGETLVLGAEKKPSRLPEGYTEVEYVHVDAQSGFDTGVQGVDYYGTQIMMDIEAETYSGSARQYIIYKASWLYVNTYYRLLFWRESETTLKDWHYPASAITRTASISNKRLTIGIDFKAGNFIVGDTMFPLTRTNTYTYPSEKNSIYLFSGTFTSQYESVPCKLYSAQIKHRGSTLTRDFVPCINPSGVVGLYDLVGAKFYGNAGTGTLTAGPAV